MLFFRFLCARWLALFLLAPSLLVASPAGVVSVSHPEAAAAGARMLAEGGNAIDAAAAVQFALNVVEPQSSGIGGGGFMMIHLARTSETFIVDSRERAPAKASLDMFSPGGLPMTFQLASTTGLAVGVPGTLHGIDLALTRWGTKKLADTLTPAIELAEKGFRINRFLADDIANDGGRTQLQPETAAIFRPAGVPLKEGDLLVQPDLAKTFKLIAANGVDVFYGGKIAQAIIKAQQRTRGELGEAGKGRMTQEDLAQYRVAIREPIVGHYRGYTLVTMPPPSSGGLTVMQMLDMLERFPLGDVSQGYGFGSAKTLHVMIEAMRLAFADRTVWNGDDDFVPVPKKGLLHPEYIEMRGAQIKTDSRMQNPEPGYPLRWEKDAAKQRIKEESPQTTHFTIIDRWGNIVSYTSTIEYTWGSGITVPGYGFLLNNELTDFNFLPSFDVAVSNPGANDVAPFKRPRSSMAPTLLFKDGKLVAAYGSPGGTTIINTLLGVTLNFIDHGMTLQQAIGAPRLSVTQPTGEIRCEGGQDFMRPRFSIAAQDALRKLNHVGLGDYGTDGCKGKMGSVQGIGVDLATGTAYGAADGRREGTVILVRP